MALETRALSDAWCYWWYDRNTAISQETFKLHQFIEHDSSFSADSLLGQ